MSTKLSPHFTLEELIRSDTARANNVSNIPNKREIENLRRLATEILEPLRKELNLPININSGFRNVKTNRLVGGVANSAHLTGFAADIVCPKYGNAAKFSKYVHDFLVRKGIKFDQVINEYGRWCHVAVSHNDGSQRKQALTIMKSGTTPGIK